jgi:beta-lactamase class A
MFVPHGSRFAVTVATRSGRYTVALRYFRRGRLLATSLASQVWLLPQSARTTVPARTTNLGWVRALRAAGASFDGYAGFWMHDISTGASAEWNADALFPAASTVKLGVLIAALKRFGPRPEGSRYGYDMGALAGWSSNLAANRLVSGLGGADVGSVAAEQTMQRLGANSSTYTGFYRVGTSARHAGNAPRQPPRVSTRVTTARDLGRLLYVLHAGAMGDPAAMRLLQLSRHEAQVGLGLLLSSAPTGDNVGLFRPSLGKTYPIAQKNGWITTARHTAAILYTSHGPVIVVVLTYRPAGLTRVDTTRLAERVLRLVHK